MTRIVDAPVSIQTTALVRSFPSWFGELTLLGLWRQKGHLTQAEFDELEQLILSSRLIPLPEPQR